MKKRTLLIAALMGGCALQSMAQQILPDDVAGDKEYRRVCREYELKSKNSVELLQAYLDKYPDSRYTTLYAADATPHLDNVPAVQ